MHACMRLPHEPMPEAKWLTDMLALVIRNMRSSSCCPIELGGATFNRLQRRHLHSLVRDASRVVGGPVAGADNAGQDEEEQDEGCPPVVVVVYEAPGLDGDRHLGGDVAGQRNPQDDDLDERHVLQAAPGQLSCRGLLITCPARLKLLLMRW